ncbi:DUF4194 domain-containing protein [Modestobacter sp. VKM Ac-2979]|uniref:DUF4194 domain-containing protein n=1 Tax=unclassified Modestobacter TaxID=2643866 RepID=UPI0022AB5886|nr:MULTISPECIES: DUF4194 domain-containing protein [unclassified Modestobacter]MCZ2813710.1 DUF4194 domain-containing protein [Modestobacter sp. VKM Ac-2979]MCZ2844315.1 DUF4194 domain-containing protein [Modestobacter sp. VKM Ac-2980]
MTTTFEEDAEYVGAEDYGGPSPLFTGDTGQLAQDVRETLVTLLKRRYISSERHGKDWRIVQENEAALRTRLNDLFLDLVIDRNYEVAYKRQAISDTGAKFPTLLYDQAWNREETILLIHLRRMMRSTQQSGDDAVFVDRSALVEEVSNFRPASSTNEVRDEKAANNAVDALMKNDILLRTAESDRYLVSSIIEVLLPVERVQDLAAWLRIQNGRPDDPIDLTDDGDPTDDPADADQAEERP